MRKDPILHGGQHRLLLLTLLRPNQPSKITNPQTVQMLRDHRLDPALNKPVRRNHLRQGGNLRQQDKHRRQRLLPSEVSLHDGGPLPKELEGG